MATEMTMAPDTASGSAVSDDLESGQQRQTEQVSSGDEGSGSVVHPDQEARVLSRERVAQPEPTSPQVNNSQPQRQLVPIPRVRGLLRGISSNLFTPQTVVIGPYQVEQGSHLLLSRAVKDKALEHILVFGRARGRDRKDLQEALNNLVNEVKPCYTHLREGPKNNPSEEQSAPAEDFSTMLLLDGCYLLRLFINFAGEAGTGDGGGDVSDIATVDAVMRDILYLFENQIPLCVLEAILNWFHATENRHYAPQLIYPGVQHILRHQGYISEQRQPVQSTPSDLLHLVYSYFRRGPDDNRPGSEQGRGRTGMRRWCRATDYHKYADMRFRPRVLKEDEKLTILDIDIRGGTLYIPPLQVNTNTMTMLRNLASLEDQEKEKAKPVTAYCLFMSQVAGTAEDVQLLQHHKILQHSMASDADAANDLAHLCAGLAIESDDPESNYLKFVWHDLDKRYRNPVHNFKGFFRANHCSTMFYRLVFVAATLAFVCTVIQAAYAVIAYHKPPHS